MHLLSLSSHAGCPWRPLEKANVLGKLSCVADDGCWRIFAQKVSEGPFAFLKEGAMSVNDVVHDCWPLLRKGPLRSAALLVTPCGVGYVPMTSALAGFCGFEVTLDRSDALWHMIFHAFAILVFSAIHLQRANTSF